MRSTKIIYLLIYAINTIRLYLAFKVSLLSQFEDPDLVNYYKPAAENISKIYITNDPDFFYLSGLVTPVWPLFLKIFGYNLLAQLFYIIVFILILILVYKITLKLSSKKTAAIAVLLVSLEPSLFISSISLSPELLFSLTLTSALYFGVCKPIKKEELNFLILGVILGISVLIRPIALVMIFCLTILWIVKYFQTSKSIFLFTTIITSSFALIWSFRNLLIHGFFNISSISSNNIFWFEGVAALSADKDISFEEAKQIEGGLKNQTVGNFPTVLEDYEYNTKRGLELIFENPIGWIQSHFKGVGKVLFGVFKSKYKIIDEKIFGIDNQMIQSIHYIILGIFVLLIWILFLNGLSLFYKLDFSNARLFVLVIIAILLPATGQVAYARFRSPIVPLICIIAAIGAQNMLNKNYKVTKWKK